MALKEGMKMPAISRIRLTNVVYEEGNKRYNDELFLFEGHNGAVLLENGGGKTVFIQTALQAVLPHADLADRKIKNTLLLENAPAHIAIEWIMNEEPRRYVVTAVSLFTTKHGLDSLRYVYEYTGNDPNGIEGIPFVKEGKTGKRTAERGEMQDYYSHMKEKSITARTFSTIKEYRIFLEEQYHIISGEWESIAKINSSEGGVETFFDECKSTNQLFDRLLIPTVENSIVGHETSLFADMFEQQHSSFKNYKKLKETLDENKKIEHQLVDYASTYEKLHNRELAYEKMKQRAKGTWNTALDEIQKFTNEQNNMLEKREEWNVQNHALKVKTASYEIFAEEAKFKELEAIYKESVIEMTEKEENLKIFSKDYYSLKMAELKLERKDQEATLKQIAEELLPYDQTEGIQDYQYQLEETKRALLGWYMTQMDGLEKERQALHYELNPILNRIETVNQTKENLQNEETVIRENLAKSEALIDSRKKDSNKLKQQLLSNPEQEEVREEVKRWEARTQYLDDEIIQLRKEVQRLSEEEKVAEERIAQYQTSFTELDRDKNYIDFELSNMEKAEKQLIEKLARLRQQWFALEDIYLSQDSIEKRIIETIDNLSKEKENLLLQERLAYRYEDDYGKQDIFFGDKYLESQLHIWKNQLDYLVTGVEFLQSSDPSQDEWKQYPLWPITLITTNKSKAKLIEKLSNISDRLQFPINVMSTEEAVSIHKSETMSQWIAPTHWENNTDHESFEKWKDDISEYAKNTTKLRIEKEKELRQWEAGLTALQQFLVEYPFDETVSRKAELSNLKNLLEELSIKLQKEKDFIKDKRETIFLHQKTIDQSREEKQGLDGKIEKAYQFLHFEKEIDDEKKKMSAWGESLKEIRKNLVKNNKQFSDLEEERTNIQSRISNLKMKVEDLRGDEEYQSLTTYTPIFNKESKKVIKAKIFSLELKLREIQSTQGELLAKKDAAEQRIQSLNKQIHELLHEHSFIDEERDFPGDGNQLMKKLWEQMTLLKHMIENLRNDVREKGSNLDKQKGKWETKIENFKQNFPDDNIISFTDSLEAIKAELLSAKAQLAERNVFITKELKRIEKELKSAEDAKLGLQLFEEGHHFSAPDIIPLAMDADELAAFTYHRKKFVQSITDQLKEKKALVDEEMNEVDRAKRRFREFCLKSITDIKLQNMAINGVEHKNSYEDIVEFKKNMLIRIEKISNYANEHIRKSDEDLQLFINRIHAHLLTLVDELKQIPKKTKVKVEEDWKQIFTFSIPEWEEEVGKMRIRDYIEWILGQLESDRFLDDKGIEDDRKVRKEIEMWLQSKQLLQMVMNNEVMKVSCRKVTNDNKVTTRSYSWEQSNVWSGGEKWSKNMTLFLGILNYVAEKKKHIQGNMKRHRAVILDNPFGKASSDHVLSPVFFVAEQLGFQVIALTAHAEGKFLQDYFPVIYSCRLRPSVDSSKKVMTKEKWLHHAYFQDHEPKAMDRLGETEQMVLFK